MAAPRSAPAAAGATQKRAELKSAPPAGTATHGAATPGSSPAAATAIRGAGREESAENHPASVVAPPIEVDVIKKRALREEPRSVPPVATDARSVAPESV